MVIDAPTGVNTATPQKVVDTKVEGDLNATAVQANGVSGSIHTDVKGTGNMTIVTVNNNYNSVHSTSAGTPAKKTTTTDKPQKQPKKSHETKTEEKSVTSQPLLTQTETEYRAELLVKAANNDGLGLGTNEEEFYNAVTTIPGKENATSMKSGDIKNYDKKVFLSKDNLIKLDKQLKLDNSTMRETRGLRYFINDEFDIKDRNDFYNNKMRELTNLLDKYGIK